MNLRARCEELADETANLISNYPENTVHLLHAALLTLAGEMLDERLANLDAALRKLGEEKRCAGKCRKHVRLQRRGAYANCGSSIPSG